MFVFLPSVKQELTISTPQIRARTVSMISLLSSHTPVTAQQLAITTLGAVIHTPMQHTPLLCPLAATVVYPLSPYESRSTLHSIQHYSREAKCQLCVFFLQHASNKSWTMKCSNPLYPVKQVSSVANIFKELERVTSMPPVFLLNPTSLSSVDHRI